MIKSNKNLIVGLDIGTSTVKTVVGIINEDNEIDFLGFGKTKSLGVKRGVVIDIGSTVESIAKSISDAKLQSGEDDIDSVYATISGNHIQSYTATGRAAISDHKEVRIQDLKAVEESAKISFENELNTDFLQKNCPKIIESTEKFCNWLKI